MSPIDKSQHLDFLVTIGYDILMASIIECGHTLSNIDVSSGGCDITDQIRYVADKEHPIAFAFCPLNLKLLLTLTPPDITIGNLRNLIVSQMKELLLRQPYNCNLANTCHCPKRQSDSIKS